MTSSEHDPILSKEVFKSSFKISSTQENENEENFAMKTVESKKQSVLIMVVVCTVFFASFSAFAIVAPFLPIEAKRTQTSLTWTGLILSSFPLVSFLASPLAGKLVSIPKIGAKRALIFGCAVEGLCEILFGLAYLMPTRATFIVYCLMLRSVTAIGSSCTLTASLTIISEVFWKNRAFAFSLTEIFTGLGLMVSPVYGGILFKYGGFPTPFIFTGAIIFSLMLIVIFFLPKSFAEVKEEEELMEIDDEKTSTLRLLRSPGVILGVLSISLAISLPSFIESSLTHHLQEITKDQISVELIGVMFLIMPATFTLSSVLTGYLVDKYLNTRYTIILGQLCSAIQFLFIGPSPLFKSAIPNNLTLLSISLALQGVFISFANIPILSDMHKSIKNAEMNVTVQTSALLSGLFVGFMSLGNAVGPILGTYLTEKYGFSWGTTIMSCITFAVVLISSMGTLIETRANQRHCIVN